MIKINHEPPPIRLINYTIILIIQSIIAYSIPLYHRDKAPLWSISHVLCVHSYNVYKYNDVVDHHNLHRSS